jgi:DNA repair and recombination protein RAD54B
VSPMQCCQNKQKNIYIPEQNPYAGGGPVIGKALIVCPVTLVNVCMSFLSFAFLVHFSSKTELESRVSQVVSNLGRVSDYRVLKPSRLGRDRVGIFTGDKDKSVIKQFINSYAVPDFLECIMTCGLTCGLHSKIHQVLVIGYEKLRTVM